MKCLLIALILLVSFSEAYADEARSFILNKGKSTIGFTATQNDAPIKGIFSVFDAEIVFSPKDLEHSYTKVTIDTNSIQASFAEASATLKNKDWFDVSIFPKAIFEAHDITHLEGKIYRAEGTLTIRDKSIPTTLDFTLKKFTSEEAEIIGSATLKRTDFGLGQGEWADTKSVKDTVTVEVHVVAKAAQ